jgi:hypothetical protein
MVTLDFSANHGYIAAQRVAMLDATVLSCMDDAVIKALMYHDFLRTTKAHWT